jgi:ABC-type transporter Mla MlaB component
MFSDWYGMRELILVAPERLDVNCRAAFVEEGERLLGELGDSPGGRLVVDLSHTREIDTTGLSLLVMLQARASERRHSVGLCNVPDHVRLLLLMTQLENRFEIDPLPPG